MSIQPSRLADFGGLGIKRSLATQAETLRPPNPNTLHTRPIYGSPHGCAPA